MWPNSHFASRDLNAQQAFLHTFHKYTLLGVHFFGFQNMARDILRHHRTSAESSKAAQSHHVFCVDEKPTMTRASPISMSSLTLSYTSVFRAPECHNRTRNAFYSSFTWEAPSLSLNSSTVIMDFCLLHFYRCSYIEIVHPYCFIFHVYSPFVHGSSIQNYQQDTQKKRIACGRLHPALSSVPYSGHCLDDFGCFFWFICVFSRILGYPFGKGPWHLLRTASLLLPLGVRLLSHECYEQSYF